MSDLLLGLSLAFFLGLAGAGHCLGMCGGLVSAAVMSTSSSDRSNFLWLLWYNFGRIFSYGLIGSVVAAGAALAPANDWPVARTLAALLLLLMGLYFLGWRVGITRVETIGKLIWPIIQPLGSKILPVNKPYKAFVLGTIWGWLPCGLVYSALAFAVTQPSVGAAGLTMLAFGLGTLPALLVGGIAATTIKRLVLQRSISRLLGAFYIAMALWTFTAAWAHLLVHQFASSTEQQNHHHH